ncbi:MAG: TMEM208 family protein [Bacteroidales bacterium]|jgi:hypothetical protein|nr:TMEM208 family protein [Bacteroidales bacterium]
MIKHNFKNVFSILIAALLIVAMQMVQSGSEIPSFKFWICFAVIVATLIYMVYVTFNLAQSLRKAKKEINRLSQQINETKEEEMQTSNIKQE